MTEACKNCNNNNYGHKEYKEYDFQDKKYNLQERSFVEYEYEHKVARKGWNDKGMWITISNGYKDLEAERVWNEHNKKVADENGGKVDILPYITMKTADNKILIGWLASQTDILSEDWEVVE